MKNIVRSKIVIYFSSNPHGICDYMAKLASHLSRSNLVICLPIYADAVVFFKWCLLLKQKRVFYLQKGAYYCRPVYLLPFQRFTAIKNINRWLFLKFIFPLVAKVIEYLYYRQKLSSNRFFIFYHPQKESRYFQNAYNLFSKDYMTVFDIVDYPDINSDAEMSYYNWYVKNADKVTVNSQVLYNYFSWIRSDIKVLPQGFSLDEFQHPLAVRSFRARQPVIGFVGAIGSRLDFNLLYGLIQYNPQYTFVFWGPRQYVEGESISKLDKKIDKLLSYPNVISGSSRNKRTIPGVIKQFNICMIPYRISDPANRYSFPMKLFEYFYIGKPILSTAIKEILAYEGLVFTRKNIHEWQQQISLLLNHPWSKQQAQKQRSLAIANSWENKSAAILDHLHSR